MDPQYRKALMDAIVGELTEEARRLAGSVDCALLFGSLARGDAGPLSDVDVAFLCAPTLSMDQRWELRLKVAGRYARIGGPHIDLVILNDAPPLLQDRVIRHGRVLVCHDDRRRVEFEARSLMEYLDFEPYLRRHGDAVIQRAREGRFGH
jgi:predicted nucleotidyltransferase